MTKAAQGKVRHNGLCRGEQLLLEFGAPGSRNLETLNQGRVVWDTLKPVYTVNTEGYTLNPMP